MNRIFKISILSMIITLCITTFCFAVSFEAKDSFETTENDKHYITKVYEVSEENDSLFKTGIINKFEEGNSVYQLESIETKGGNLVLTKNETQIKIIETNTEEQAEILKQLPEKIEYNENDGYVGELVLDKTSITTTKVSGGSYKKSYTVKEDVSFSNYAANDLYDIPKTKYKNGVNMKLLNVDWRIQTTEYVAGTQVPLTYSGVAHYSGVGTKTVESEAKYSTSAEYKGEIKKEEIQPITYYVRYVEVNNKTLSIILTTAFIILLLALALYFLLNKNVKIYNLQNDEFVLIDRRNINYINPIINLNNLDKKSITNIYKIVLSKSLTKKISGMKVKVTQGSKNVQHLVNAYGVEYSFDITI